MKAIRRFTVRAVIPSELSALEELATNLRWSWHEPTKELFEAVSPEDWEATDQDPVALLGRIGPARLAELAADSAFVGRAEELRSDLRDYLASPRWYQSLTDAPARVAYFSPEFGIAQALPQYSGGLGILAGDHLKAASDLGVPLVGVGLFYHSGYFRQSISPDGWQEESYPVLDPDGLPLSALRDPDGAPAHIDLALPENRTLSARVWIAQVGRVPLLLLDTDIPSNDDDLRGVTDRLYGGGGEHRLRQELLLGIGGARAVKRWAAVTGAEPPEVFHTNEGHAGFLGLERISDLVGQGLSFTEALQAVRGGTVFTTHTPVPAGIDRFELSLVERYVSDGLLPHVEVGDVLGLGAENYDGGSPDVFNMAVMGLRLAQRANGVSKLHGRVSRRMFAGLWPGFDADEVPIASITNGVHAPTWTDPELAACREQGRDDDAGLWEAKRRMRARLVEDARRRIGAAWKRDNPAGIVPGWIDRLLDPDVLTIGFARRVPSYKRLTLMLRDPERLRTILTNPNRPVQLVVAGKSHPADDDGKRLIQRLVQFTQDPELRERIVFLPDYDIGMAQILYPGTDVWLNNPLRPFEACGTSGMKAALNGSLNLSILDGWWDEFYDGENGWAIPTADGAADAEERDTLEATALYDLIEHEIAPRFYDRNGAGVPVGWLRSVRHTLDTLSGALSADRMLREYVERLYLPAGGFERRLTADGCAAARGLAAWKERVREAWPAVAVTHVESGGVGDVARVGDAVEVRAWVELGTLTTDDVAVEIAYGHNPNGGELSGVRFAVMEPGPAAGETGSRVFSGRVELDAAGPFGYTVRVVPRHELLVASSELGLIATA